MEVIKGYAFFLLKWSPAPDIGGDLWGRYWWTERHGPLKSCFFNVRIGHFGNNQIKTLHLPALFHDTSVSLNVLILFWKGSFGIWCVNSYWDNVAFLSLVKGRDLESCLDHFTGGSWQTRTCSRITKKPGLYKCLAGLIDMTFSWFWEDIIYMLMN